MSGKYELITHGKIRANKWSLFIKLSFIINLINEMYPDPILKGLYQYKVTGSYNPPVFLFKREWQVFQQQSVEFWYICYAAAIFKYTKSFGNRIISCVFALTVRREFSSSVRRSLKSHFTLFTWHWQSQKKSLSKLWG